MTAATVRQIVCLSKRSCILIARLPLSVDRQMENHRREESNGLGGSSSSYGELCCWLSHSRAIPTCKTKDAENIFAEAPPEFLAGSSVIVEMNNGQLIVFMVMNCCMYVSVGLAVNMLRRARNSIQN